MKEALNVMNLIINTTYMCLKTGICPARLIHFHNGPYNTLIPGLLGMTAAASGSVPAIGSCPAQPPSVRAVPGTISQGPQLDTVFEFKQKLFLLLTGSRW